MLRYLLDTNIALFVIRWRPPLAAAVFNQHAGRMAVSAITLAELMHGAEKSSRPAANLAVVEEFCSRLELAGTPIGVDDLHIAAHARSEGLVIVTKHRREFDRVPALQVEDWSLWVGRRRAAGFRPIPKLEYPPPVRIRFHSSLALIQRIHHGVLVAQAHTDRLGLVEGDVPVQETLTSISGY